MTPRETVTIQTAICPWFVTYNLGWLSGISVPHVFDARGAIRDCRIAAINQNCLKPFPSIPPSIPPNICDCQNQCLFVPILSTFKLHTALLSCFFPTLPAYLAHWPNDWAALISSLFIIELSVPLFQNWAWEALDNFLVITCYRYSVSKKFIHMARVSLLLTYTYWLSW